MPTVDDNNKNFTADNSTWTRIQLDPNFQKNHLMLVEISDSVLTEKLLSCTADQNNKNKNNSQSQEGEGNQNATGEEEEEEEEEKEEEEEEECFLQLKGDVNQRGVVLCTDNETYEMREAETSNSMYLTADPALVKLTNPKIINLEGEEEEEKDDPMEVDQTIPLVYFNSMVHNFYELRKISPRFDVLSGLLEKDPYEGPLKEIEHYNRAKNTPGIKKSRGYRYFELLDRVQASKGELTKCLRDYRLRALFVPETPGTNGERKGRWRRIGEDYYNRALELLLVSLVMCEKEKKGDYGEDLRGETEIEDEREGRSDEIVLTGGGSADDANPLLEAVSVSKKELLKQMAGNIISDEDYFNALHGMRRVIRKEWDREDEQEEEEEEGEGPVVNGDIPMFVFDYLVRRHTRAFRRTKKTAALSRGEGEGGEETQKEAEEDDLVLECDEDNLDIVYVFDIRAIVRFFAGRLFRITDRWNVKDFLSDLKESLTGVIRGIDDHPNREGEIEMLLLGYLNGMAFIQGGNLANAHTASGNSHISGGSSQANDASAATSMEKLLQEHESNLHRSIFYFPNEKLPMQPMARFRALFKAQEKWSQDSLEPFLRDICTPTAPLNTHLLKYTRHVVDPVTKTKYYTKRH